MLDYSDTEGRKRPDGDTEIESEMRNVNGLIHNSLMIRGTLTLCLCQHRQMPLRLPIKHSTFHIEH